MRTQSDQKAHDKLFGIGFGRTGTKSLTEALRYLGFNIVHYPTDSETIRSICRGEPPLDVIDRSDGIIRRCPYPLLQTAGRTLSHGTVYT